MTTIAISGSRVETEIGLVSNDERCFCVTDLNTRKAIILKGYDEMVSRDVCEMSHYSFSIIHSLDVGDTYSGNKEYFGFVVTRVV